MGWEEAFFLAYFLLSVYPKRHLADISSKLIGQNCENSGSNQSHGVRMWPSEFTYQLQYTPCYRYLKKTLAFPESNVESRGWILGRTLINIGHRQCRRVVGLHTTAGWEFGMVLEWCRNQEGPQQPASPRRKHKGVPRIPLPLCLPRQPSHSGLHWLEW